MTLNFRSAVIFVSFGKLYPSAKYFRIGIRRLAEKVFIVGTDGEKRRINSAERCGEGYELVPAEVQLYRYRLAVQRHYHIFYGFDCCVYLNHITIFALIW